MRALVDVNVLIALLDQSDEVLTPDREWVYVGETAKDVEERFLEHLMGHKASPAVKRFGTELRLDLMVEFPEHRSSAESKAYEAYVGHRLGLLGYGVKGAH